MIWFHPAPVRGILNYHLQNLLCPGPWIAILQKVGTYAHATTLGPIRKNDEKPEPVEGGQKMSNSNQVSLKKVSYVMLGGGAIALALVALVWGIIGIFVI